MSARGIAAVLVQVRALRAQAEAMEAQLVELVSADPAPAGEDLLGEADLVPRYFHSARVLRDTVRSGELVASRNGRKIVVRRADLLAFLDGRRAKPRGPRPVQDEAPRPASDPLARAGLRIVGGAR